MARIAIGGLHHETNTFAPQPATFERFARADGWPELLRGSDLPARIEGINLPISGFAAAAAARGHDIVPLLWANAGPSGPVTTDAYERITGWLLEDLARARPVDGLYLDLHGAMVTDALADGEGEFLRRLRLLTGPDLPVVCSLDLHANVSPEMIEAADALVAFRTYPHVDMALTGSRCLPLLEQCMAGGRLAKASARGQFLIPLPWQCSTIEPGRRLYARLAELEVRHGCTLSMVMGFPAADVPFAGPIVLGYAPESTAAAAAVRSLAQVLADAEGEFAGRFWSAEEAVAHALSQPLHAGPVIIADTQDNPGGGGTGDTTGLLKALIAARPERAALGLLIDPEAAAAATEAGAGALLEDMALGGRHGPAGVTPWRGATRVERLGDGRFRATGPFYGGNDMELGPMALLRPLAAPGLAVLVASRALQAADQAMFRHLGIEPAQQQLLALKSSVHFRADFEPLARAVLICRSPGYVTADPRDLPFQHLPATLRRAPIMSSPKV